MMFVHGTIPLELRVPEPQTEIVTYVEDGPITVGTLINSTMLDGSVVSQLGDQVIRDIGDRSDVNLLLDFRNVEYLSSAALTELIKINDAVISGGGSMRICGLTPPIQKVFEITRFDKSFDIQAGETTPHAIARFKRSIQIGQEQDAWEKKSGR
jgi:anti-sigma B factor antagonist